MLHHHYRIVDLQIVAATNCVACVSVKQLNAFILSTLVAATAKAKSGNLLLSRKRQEATLLPRFLLVQQLEKLLKNICWFEK